MLITSIDANTIITVGTRGATIPNIEGENGFANLRKHEKQNSKRPL